MSNNTKDKTPAGTYIGGMIGFVIGFALFMSTNLNTWALIIPIFVGAIIGFNTSDKKASEREENERVSKERIVLEYKVIVERLPKEQMERLRNILAGIVHRLAAAGFGSQDLPFELAKMLVSVSKLMEGNQYGSLTEAQCKAVNKVLDDFETSTNVVLLTKLISLNQAPNQGLGFGIIGSSADVALYHIMDKAERIKNVKSSINSTEQYLDQAIQKLRTNLQEAITN